MNQQIADLEEKTQLGATSVAKLLGIAYTTYAPYKSGNRTIPDYIQHSIHFLMLMDADTLRLLLVEYSLSEQTYGK